MHTDEILELSTVTNPEGIPQTSCSFLTINTCIYILKDSEEGQTPLPC
jgi:hypothetical protein